MLGKYIVIIEKMKKLVTGLLVCLVVVNTSCICPFEEAYSIQCEPKTHVGRYDFQLELTGYFRQRRAVIYWLIKNDSGVINKTDIDIMKNQEKTDFKMYAYSDGNWKETNTVSFNKEVLLKICFKNIHHKDIIHFSTIFKTDTISISQPVFLQGYHNTYNPNICDRIDGQ